MTPRSPHGVAAPAGGGNPPTAPAGVCLWVLEHDGHGRVTERCREQRLPMERLCADHYIEAMAQHPRT